MDIQRTEERSEQNQVKKDKSFKNALTEVVMEDRRKEASCQGLTANFHLKPEVVWEVEVDDEVLTKLEGAYVGYLADGKEAISIQNRFRMGGFQSLKICALGYRMILLWSDKVGEVKEVIESVGWWCSLFEKVVPWSPTLVSNQRVTWLRCYGVPVHAWGLDLFRALAFKFGRFIEVDEQAKQMKRLDTARIKILTGVSKLIDSSMAVKVQGRRFDIRVVEDMGGWPDGGSLCGRRWDVEDDGSSRALSVGGASMVALVDGVSDLGSEEDVKLPGSIQGAKKSKGKNGSRRGRSATTHSGSDSSHCSEVGEGSVFPEIKEPTGCGLEIVLPFENANTQNLTSTLVREESGLGYLVEGRGAAVEVQQNIEGEQNGWSEEDVAVPREVEEAKKLIDVGGELGLSFQDSHGKDVDRMYRHLGGGGGN
ncbi:hypothetical protein TSUD_324650 [Trifolium subterraneum]|uniref:Uncharacterized protein n=1 Tax=Trifolium subterraneum TaxID=3900 RepID=A0A2Z6NZP6_TRISU|nr:hypothetical protein TSUD_324650 [Trifolium subterraneum]